MSLDSFSSYWGNALQGMYIKWKIDSLGTDGAISATTKLTLTFDARMYATGFAGIESGNNL